MVGSYFTRLPANAKTAKHDPASLALANNGWIWDADPLANFAERPSKAYLRREVMCVVPYAEAIPFSQSSAG